MLNANADEGSRSMELARLFWVAYYYPPFFLAITAAFYARAPSSHTTHFTPLTAPNAQPAKNSCDMALPVTGETNHQ
jgi:hypothetical protein